MCLTVTRFTFCMSFLFLFLNTCSTNLYYLQITSIYTFSFFFSLRTPSLDNKSLYSSLYLNTENTNMLFRSVPKTVNYKITKKKKIELAALVN
ncbi:hypothetical protein BDF21DRAFT_6519 [Thamnidium elegans]|nr:hypothetical protein BDF21DRAFT_6519 [Thamnidium elegans]